jgi:hypothetical protein
LYKNLGIQPPQVHCNVERYSGSDHIQRHQCCLYIWTG